MLNLFFLADVSADPTILLTGDEAHHAIKVLRMHIGDELLLSDGLGHWVRGSIVTIEKNAVSIQVIERGIIQNHSPSLVVIQALPKSDRIKETLELLTEAGANRIVPWESERSISKWQDDSLNKWRSGVVAASKQSRRFHIPVIEQPFSFSDAVELSDFDTSIIVLHESATLQLSTIFQSEKVLGSERFVVVIGPEGGLTDSEIEKFTHLGAKIAHLGEPIFRSAHAGAVALAAIQALIGRW